MVIRAAILLFIAALPAVAQFAPYSFSLTRGRGLDVEPPEPRLTSNVIIDILPGRWPQLPPGMSELWLGTGSGVTRMMLPLAENGRPAISFESFGEAQGLGKGGVSGLVVTDSILWAAFAFDTSVGISGAGGGLAYSRDNGHNWTWLPQPRDRLYDLDERGYDRVLGYWPTATNVDNITYGIALSDSFVWIVSKGGGLRRHPFAADYTDYNDTTGWRLVSPDTNDFHPIEFLNHRAFSVLYAEGALWVGTAGGINKTTDNGRTWRRITALNSGISGNFVTALDYQPSAHALWAATWRAEGINEFYAVSRSTDGGETWSAQLTEDQIRQATGMSDLTPRAHAFAFADSIVYVCDDLGLWKSPDGGTTWDLFPTIQDQETGHRLYEPQVYTALKSEGRLWMGGVDGLAVSPDDGRFWYIIQTALNIDNAARPVQTYAYPSPWSPQRFGPVKLRYSTAGGVVKITVYDFAMSKVVELPSVTRDPGEQYEVWDGRKGGEIVANGTYFYKIERPEGEVWGKIVVLD